MEILGYLSGLAVGFVMGFIGSGGSILCVPIFVYLFGMNSLEATTLSLFSVGTTSLTGAIVNIVKKKIHLKNALLFGIPSVVSVILVRKFVIPHLPEVFFHIGSFEITKHFFLLFIFAVLMIFSAIRMIRPGNSVSHSHSGFQAELLIVQGFGVGIITGLIGAGGGFLIVPALVLLLGMPMKEAIGTSLLIVAMNALLGFASSMNILPIPWDFLILFTSICIGGIIIGMVISRKINGSRLQPAFGWFVLLIGCFIILKETVLH